MNKKTPKSMLYMRGIGAGMLVVVLASFLCSTWIWNQMLDFQLNIIGVLYEMDAKQSETYLHAMFAAVTEEHMESGRTAMQKYGFTETGIRYIGKNIGLWESGMVGSIGFLLLAVFVFVLFCKMAKAYRFETDAMAQEMFALRQKQMKEEYIADQNRKIQSFIENIAHQMKTPLSRVFTSLDIVEESLEEETAKQHVEECYQHLESMKVLMKRLMDIGRLEAGKVIFQKERFSLHEFLTEVKESCGEGAERIALHNETEYMEYYGDERWLKEAFFNILCNALEADKAGKPVEISCSSNEDYVRISIRDYGPGLSEKDIPNIFDRFYLPEHVKENHTGIGLNLAKLIIEGHMGSVYVYNHLERGAVFQVILPVYDSLKLRI